MRYNIIQTSRGKETVIMTDSLKKVNARIKTLRKSHRGQHCGLRGPTKVSFRIEESESKDIYRKRPHTLKLAG